MNIIKYIYYHFYFLVKRFSDINTNKSVIFYLSFICFSLTFPFVGYLLFKVIGKENSFVFIGAFPIYAFLVYVLIRNFLIRNIDINKLTIEYKNESQINKFLGCFIALVILVAAPILGFTVLSWF